MALSDLISKMKNTVDEAKQVDNPIQKQAPVDNAKNFQNVLGKAFSSFGNAQNENKSSLPQTQDISRWDMYNSRDNALQRIANQRRNDELTRNNARNPFLQNTENYLRNNYFGSGQGARDVRKKNESLTNALKDSMAKIDDLKEYNGNGTISVAPDDVYESAKTVADALDRPWESPMFAYSQNLNRGNIQSILDSPYMTIDDDKVHLRKDEDLSTDDKPVWVPEDNYAEYLFGDDGKYKMAFQNGEMVLYPKNPEENPLPGTIAWKNGEAILNPSQFERDAYEYIMSPEFQQYMRDEYGIDDFGADMLALRTRRDLRPAWLYFMQGMNDKGKGYYDSTYLDPRFYDDQGNFSGDRYFDYFDNEANILDYLLGNVSAEAGDLLTSGGLEANRMAAAYLTSDEMMPQIRFGFDDTQMSDEDWNNYLQLIANEGYTPGDLMMLDADSDWGIGTNDDGSEWYLMSANQRAARDYILRNMMMDAMTNYSLDEQYGAYAPSANDVNLISDLFNQSDLYWDYAGGDRQETIGDPYSYYGGNPEEYRNYFQPYYGDLVSYMSNGVVPEFNIGATAYNNYPNLRKFYSNRS